MLDKHRQARPVILHAVQDLMGWVGEPGVGQCLIAPGGQVMYGLL